MVTYERFLEMAKADAARCGESLTIPGRIESAHREVFFTRWETGGAVHSELYGELKSVRQPDPEPEIEPLLELLDDLGVRRRGVNQVKAILTRREDRETLDHEGSWATFEFKHLTIEDLHRKLVELGVVEAAPAT